MSDPFPNHHPSENLEGSASISPVDADSMDHAARQAAKLADESARAGAAPGGAGKKSSRKPAASVAAAAEAPSRTSKRQFDDVADAADAVTSTSDTAAEVATETAHGARNAAEAVMEPAEAVNEDLAAAARAAAQDLRSRSEAFGAAADETASKATDAMAAFRGKLVDAVQANIESSVSFLTSMMQVTSLSDAVALNARHLRKQMDAFITQGGELTSLAQQAATDSLKSLKPPFGRPHL